MNTTDSSPALFERMAALADPVRGRLLRVLERHELSVGELCAVFQLPQSTMSRHLKVLSEEGWLVARAEGATRRYRMLTGRLDAEGGQLWMMVRAAAERLGGAAHDEARVRSVLAERRQRSRDFFRTAASEWDRVRSELYGRRLDLQALLGLVDEEWVVGDLGCGTGQVSATLAPFVARVVGVDDSPQMLEAAAERLEGQTNVELRPGTLEALPLADDALDAAVCFLVLHYLAEPVEALREAARVLRRGGRLLVVDMVPHPREEYRQSMGHQWQGFSAEQMLGWMEEAGLAGGRWTPLPHDPEARGPGLFVATARRR